MTPRRRRLIVGMALIAPLSDVGRHSVLFGALGAGADKDLFDAAWVIPDLLVLVLTGSYLTMALTPASGSGLPAERESTRTITAVARVVSVVAVTACAFGIALSPQLATGLFPAIEDTVRLAGLMRVALAAAMFVALGSVVASAASDRYPWWPAAVPLIHLAGVLGGGVIGAADDPGAYAWGRLSGSVVGFALTAIVAHRRGLVFEWSTPLRHRSLNRRRSMLAPLTATTLLFGTGGVWIRWVGQFAGEGALGVVSATHALAMVAVIATTTVLPMPSNATDNPWLRAAMGAAMRNTVTRSLPAAALLVALAHPIVEMIYQWGRFDRSASEVTATLVVFAAIAIPFVAVQPILLSSLATRGLVSTAHGAGVVAGVVAGGAAWAGLEAIGSSGVVLAWVMWSVLATVLLAVRRQHHPSMSRHVALSALAAAVAGAVSTLVARLGSTMEVAAWVVVIVGITLGTATWLVVGRLSGLVTASVGIPR